MLVNSGDYLREKYNSATKVKPTKNGRLRLHKRSNYQVCTFTIYVTFTMFKLDSPCSLMFLLFLCKLLLFVAEVVVDVDDDTFFFCVCCAVGVVVVVYIFPKLLNLF